MFHSKYNILLYLRLSNHGYAKKQKNAETKIILYEFKLNIEVYKHFDMNEYDLSPKCYCFLETTNNVI